MGVRVIKKGSGSCSVGWGWTDANPTQFFYLATTSGEADVSGGIARALRKVTISGLVPGKSWNITITSITPDTTLGSVSSGVIPPLNPGPADPAFTSGSPASTMITLHLVGNAGLGGSWTVQSPIGSFTYDGSEINIPIGPFQPNTTINIGDIKVRASNSGGNSSFWVSWPATSTGPEAAAPDVSGLEIDTSGIPFSFLDGLESPPIDCAKWIMFLWYDDPDWEIDTWTVWISTPTPDDIISEETFDRHEHFWKYVGSLILHYYLVAYPGIGFPSPNPTYIRLRGTNDSGYSEVTSVAYTWCWMTSLLAFKMPNGLETYNLDDYDGFVGNPNIPENLLTVDEFDGEDEDLYGRKTPFGKVSGASTVLTYAAEHVFTVPRLDAAVKADAGYSDIRQTGFGAAQADIHMILQEKSVSKLHPIRPGARRHVLVNDVIYKFLKAPDVTLSIGTDGSLTLSDTNHGSLNISDGYDLGAITLQDDDSGSITLTETEQVPVSYIGEKL